MSATKLRIAVATIGWTGHAFPAFALARELSARGHEVVVDTFERWRDVVEGFGAGFRAAEEMISLEGVDTEHGGPPMATVVRELGDLLAADDTDVVVSDLFTIAPAFAAELAGLRRATLIPHPYPVHAPGLPFYPLGLAPPRTPLGSGIWNGLWPAVGTRLPNTRLRAVRAALDRVRAELGLGPLRDYDGQISEQLALVATFPQLEYPRRWPAHVKVTGPLPFEVPHPPVEPPPGDAPLVVVAASTERDPELKLIAAALEALADEPVRVLASTNRRGTLLSGPTPANATVVDWISYSEAMRNAAAVICHGGHGTVSRALAAGAPALVVPPAGDMAENGARVSWAGAGLMLPQRLLSVSSLRLATRRLLEQPSFEARAAELAAWAAANDAAKFAADEVERLAGS